MSLPTQEDGRTESADRTAADLLEVVEEIATQLHSGRGRRQAATLDSSLERELGLDSLARVELVARIDRRFGLSLPDRVFAEVETPRDLLRALLSAGGRRVPEPDRRIEIHEVGEAGAAPHRAQTLVEVLDWHLRHNPDRPLVQLHSDEGEGEIITYRRLQQGAKAVAGGLQLRGMQPGDAVAVMLPTGREYFLAFFGILLAGGVPVPIYPPVRAKQIEDHLRRHRRILANCRAKILITVAEANRLAWLIKSQTEQLRHVVTVEELCSSRAGFTAPAVGGQDIAFLQYTSGSTGNPKGVVLTHANLLANIRAMGEALVADSTDVVVSWLPLYHDMGLIGSWLAPLYYAARLVVMSPLAFLARPQRWLWAIHRHQATISGGPNFAYELCLRRIDEGEIEGLDLSSWRFAFNGAEPVNPVTVERFCDRFGRYGLQREALAPVYGLAESTVALAFPPMGRGPVIDSIQREPFMRDGRAVPADETDANPLRFVACGQPLPGHQMRVVDATGRELPERSEGRLLFLGPSATGGYYRDAEATRSLFREEWLDSGDLAYIAAGEVYITRRIKDVIIRAGRNVFPYELEEAVGDLPDIRKGRVAVFSSTDVASGTERLVVLAETRRRDPEVRRRLRVRINGLATDLVGGPPDEVILAPPNTVLKTSSGKIRRAASRELYECGRIGQAGGAVWRQMARLALASVVPALRRAKRITGAAMFAGYSWCVAGLLAVPTWLVVALSPRDSWRWSAMRMGLHLLAKSTRTPLVIHGLENLPPPDRPCVVVSNHASYLDSLVLVATVPRQLGFIAKVELNRGVALRTLLHRVGVEFVERFDSRKGVLDARRISRVCRQGRSLAFFPEGTFTRVPGLRPFHMGAFVAATEAGVPVVPVAIRGTRSMLLSDTWFPRPGSIAVTVGPPIVPETAHGEAGVEPWTVALELRNAAREFIVARCGEPDLGGELHAV